MNMLCCVVLPCAVGLLLLGTRTSNSQVLTIEFAPSPAIVSNVLVAHGENWSWRRGTNEPQANWMTVDDVGLDATWLNAPGGFGYGDDAIVGEATRVNPGMQNIHTTLYIRQAFSIPEDVAPQGRLVLTVDYDDGFVAYVDGVEVARRNVPGTVGSHIANTATTGGVSHEASCCQSPNPASVIDLGLISGRWGAGRHILALVGVNQVLDSSDFHLIADLSSVTTPPPPPFSDQGLYALSTLEQVTLTGSNTVAASTRVTVNGDDALPGVAPETWSFSATLTPGFNRFYIAAHDALGGIVTNFIQDVVYEAATMSANGVLSENTAWNDASQIIRITDGVTIPAGVELEIGPGIVVILSPGAFIMATAGGTINVAGERERRANFLPAGPVEWGWLMADGAGAALNIQHGEIVSGQVRVFDGALGLVEDSIIRDLPDLSREVIECVQGAGFTARRVYMTRFTEGDSQDTPVLFEDSLLEEFLVDGLDIKATDVPLIIRRSTFRNADPNNSNADAIDFGPGAGTVEKCLIRDFPDKGVSIGGAPGTHVSDTLFYRCGIGVSAYASSNVVVVNCTIANCETGIQFRDNPTRATGVGTNLVVWGSVTNVAMRNTSTMDIHYSDIQGTNYPGIGNISMDPLFVDAEKDDFRLAPGSPALGSGALGANMGVPFPIGGIPSTPDQLVALASVDHHTELRWLDTSENEHGFDIFRSSDGVNWESLGMAPADAISFVDTTALLVDQHYYRVQATNDVGHSEYSNRARGIAIQSTVPDLTIAQTNPSEVVLTFQAAAGQSHRLQSRASLSEGTWTNWLEFPAATDGSIISVTNSSAATQAYFRLTSP